MKLTFPFRNIAYNTFSSFVDYDFINRHFGHGFLFVDESPEKDIEDFNGNIADFENEILQVINTSNQETIDNLFSSLKDIYKEFVNIDEKALHELVQQYNKDTYEQFVAEIKIKEEDYFKKEERYKYKHLEKYKAYTHNFYMRSLEMSEFTNYNYYCIENNPELADYQYFDRYVEFVLITKNNYLNLIQKYLVLYKNGEIKARADKFFSKIVVYVEGEHDVTFIKRSAELLDYGHILDKIELRQRGGYRNLDKIWSFYKENSVEITPQKKILLYDCDTQKKDEDFGLIYKRVMPTLVGHQISKGIENLFGTITTQRAISHKKEFIDFTFTRKIVRGVESYSEVIEINKEEKANFCEWICQNGTKADFQNFEIIFKILSDIIDS